MPSEWATLALPYMFGGWRAKHGFSAKNSLRFHAEQVQAVMKGRKNRTFPHTRRVTGTGNGRGKPNLRQQNFKKCKVGFSDWEGSEDPAMNGFCWDLHVSENSQSLWKWKYRLRSQRERGQHYVLGGAGGRNQRGGKRAASKRQRVSRSKDSAQGRRTTGWAFSPDTERK